MANNKTLTATDAIVSVTVPGLFDIPFVLDEFEMDNAFQLSDVTLAQTQLSLDGKLVGGYVPSIVDFTVNILPTSVVKDIFVDWMQKSRLSLKMFKATINVTMKGQLSNYLLTEVVLVTGNIMPSVNSVAQPVSYKFQVSSHNIVATSL